MLYRTRSLLASIVAVSLAIACATFDHGNPYPHMEAVRYGTSHAYVFQNGLSDKLIIDIEGSGWDSVLGSKDGKRWRSTTQIAQLLQVLGDTYAFFVPEKFNRRPGSMDNSKDATDRLCYSYDNLLHCYLDSINGYLDNHSFSSIILIGNSEGALLLPLLYKNMKDRSKVTAMVSFAFGGLSFRESFKVLSASPHAPKDWKEMYAFITKKYESYTAANHDPEFDSANTGVYGVTYRYLSSFIDIRPFDYYKDIDIPVLFIHGEKDYYVPVESTRYVQENLPGKPFEFRYYGWAHNPEGYFDSKKLREDIAGWIAKIDKG